MLTFSWLWGAGVEDKFECDEGICGLKCEAGNGGTLSDVMVAGGKEVGWFLKFSGSNGWVVIVEVQGMASAITQV